MLIWDVDPACEMGSVSSLDLNWTPRSVAQLRALVALHLTQGLDREDLDYFAGVSNGPALMSSLHEDGFYMPRGAEVPFVMIGSFPRAGRQYGRQYLGQYWLTAIGRKTVSLLLAPGAKFRKPVGGFKSIAHALENRDALFGHLPGHEKHVRLARIRYIDWPMRDPLFKLSAQPWSRDELVQAVAEGEIKPASSLRQLAVHGRVNWSKAEAACVRWWGSPSLAERAR